MYKYAGFAESLQQQLHYKEYNKRSLYATRETLDTAVLLL